MIGPQARYRSLFAVIALFQIFYLWRASQYLLPLGDDGVVYLWPVGRFMAQASPGGFATALVAGFLGEDHLSPLNNLFGYLCALFSPDPTVVLNVAAKLLYLAFVMSSLIVVGSLWKSRRVLLFFFLLVTFDLSMTWRNMILPGAPTLHMMAPLWSLFFLHRFLKGERKVDLSGFAICYLLLTFSFESAFVAMPLLALYALCMIWKKEISRPKKIKELARIAGLMTVLFLPYLMTHIWLYGTPIPSSRAGLVATGGWATHALHDAKIAAYQMSIWCFGIAEFVAKRSPAIQVAAGAVTLTAIVWGLARVRRRGLPSLSPTGKILLLGFFSMLACVMYTGRAEPGMWTLPGTILCMVLADLLSQKASIKTAVALIMMFAVLNEAVRPFDRAEKYYRRPFESSQAAYRALNEATDRIVVVRLPEAEPLMHPMAFWMGNKIYHKEPGLWMYPQYRQLLFKNMNMEFYGNVEGRPFGAFRPFFTRGEEGETAFLVKGENLFSRIFPEPHHGTILRASVIPYASQGRWTLHFPDLSWLGDGRLVFSLTFKGKLQNVDQVFYGGRTVTMHAFPDAGEGRTVFETNDLSPVNDLSVSFHGSGTRLELIEVEADGMPEPTRGAREAGRIKGTPVSLTTAGMPCRYWIGNVGHDLQSESPDDFGIYGTLDAGRTVSFQTLVPGALEVSYVSFGTNRKRRNEGKVKLDGDTPAVICGPAV